MTVLLNGERRDLSEGTTVADVVRLLTPSETGVAVAVNGVVLPRSGWGTTTVQEHDEVEVLTAVQGG